MWKRDDNVRPPAGRETTAPPIPASVPGPPISHGADTDARRHMDNRDVVNIGKSVVIRGELNGSEDLTVEGVVDGKIELREHVLTIGPNGRIKAEIFAKSVIVLGQVTGNITASEKVDIRDSGAVDGNIVAPRVGIAEGASFRGSVDMQRKAEAAKPAEEKKVVTAPPAPPAVVAPKA
jgi:cytoskeletal protein CcmA (bactofilin family)